MTMDNRFAATRLREAEAALEAAQAALPAAVQAVNAAREQQAELGASKTTRSALAIAFRNQARVQEVLEQAHASVRVAQRAAAAEQAAQEAGRRVAKRHQDELDRQANVMARLRVALAAVEAFDREHELPIKAAADWRDLLAAITKVVSTNSWRTR